jgi:Arc/MetJ-type ribon-helix-helix transcriptional regulator
VGRRGRIVASYYDERMNKVRLSASVDADLLAAAEAAVARGQLDSVSAWVNEALRAKAEHDRRLEALGAFVASYEKEHGEISADEMRAAARITTARAVGRPAGRLPSRRSSSRR